MNRSIDEREHVIDLLATISVLCTLAENHLRSLSYDDLAEATETVGQQAHTIKLELVEDDDGSV